MTKAFKKAFSDTGRSDISDAHVVDERLCFGRLPAPFMVNEIYQPLQRLTRFRQGEPYPKNTPHFVVKVRPPKVTFHRRPSYEHAQ